jgi:hypothetical protein
MQTNKLLALKMTENYSFSITPPPELVRQWLKERTLLKSQPLAHTYLATRAAQWGADLELDACCEWLEEIGPSGVQLWGDDLRKDRRPKPPSLKEQALEIVRGTPVNSAGLYSYEHVEIIRRALEQLDD